MSRELPWRRPVASLNYLLSSHVWRQDHNGFSHQDPGFIDHVMAAAASRAHVPGTPYFEVGPTLRSLERMTLRSFDASDFTSQLDRRLR